MSTPTISQSTTVLDSLLFRDAFGTPDELRPILDGLKTEVTLHVVERGDHSLAPSRRQEVIAETYADVQSVIASWIRSRA